MRHPRRMIWYGRCQSDESSLSHPRDALPSGVSMLSPSKIAPDRYLTCANRCHEVPNASDVIFVTLAATTHGSPPIITQINVTRTARDLAVQAISTYARISYIRLYGFVPICTFMVDHAGLARRASTRTDDGAAGPRLAQVREGNFPAEIPDGISRRRWCAIVPVVRSDVECPSCTLVLKWSYLILRELPDR